MSADAVEAWRRRRAAEGPRVTVLDLYALVAAERGVAPADLPAEDRRALARQALAEIFPGFELTGSERGDGPLVLAGYDPAWRGAFAAWRDRITGALGAAARRVEHVGSTAVPGLPAKPVIDVQVSVADQAAEAAYAPALAALGLQLRSRDDDHRYLRPAPDLPRDAHVYVCTAGGRWERDHLLLRDYLRAHGPAREAYAAAKRAAVRDWADDRVAYTEAKTGVILDLLDEAERWAAASGWAVA